MNLTIELNDDVESRLMDAASRHGLEPAVYVKQIIEQSLSYPEKDAKDSATLALLAQWDKEDATNDPDEMAARQRELEEFKHAIDQNRLESEGPGSRKIFP